MDISHDVGPGWVPIVQPAVDKLEALGAHIFQVKEKFGGLRIYVDKYTETTDKIIIEAEKKCAETCEYCGAPGKINNIRGWIKTTCEEHKNGNRNT